VAIEADTTYPDLMDKQKQSALSTNLNYRHKMSQYAQRASVAFHTQVNTCGRTGLIAYEETTVLNSEANVEMAIKGRLLVAKRSQIVWKSRGNEPTSSFILLAW